MEKLITHHSGGYGAPLNASEVYEPGDCVQVWNQRCTVVETKTSALLRVKFPCGREGNVRLCDVDGMFVNDPTIER